MFKKTKKADNIENNSNPKDSAELSFVVYKMPKHYKVGRFDEKKSVSSSSSKKEIKLGAPVSPDTISNSSHPIHQRNKKLGFILLLTGLVLLGFLVYLIISYANNSNFSLTKIFGSGSSNSAQQNLGGKDIVDIVKENNINNEEEVSEESEEATSTEEEIILEEEATSTIPEMLETTKFLDSDSDGLSDEEELLLGTDKLKIDSDGDGYTDLQEIQNLYNPIGEGALNKNVNISQYQSKSLGYSVLYPFAWEVNALLDDSSVIFSVDKNSFIQILVEENPDKQNIRAWYANRFFDLIDEKDLIKNQNWQGVYSSDGMAFYLSDTGMKNVYTILYNVPVGQEKIFSNIFNLMIKSFSVK